MLPYPTLATLPHNTRARTPTNLWLGISEIFESFLLQA